MKLNVIAFIVGLLCTFGSFSVYIDARYYDKEDVDFKFKEVNLRLDSIKRIQCALVADIDKILYRAECQ